MISLFNQIIEEFPPGLTASLGSLDSELLNLTILACPDCYSGVSGWIPVGNWLHAIQYTNGEL